MEITFNLCNRIFSPGPYDLAIKNAHFLWRFLRAFSVQNLDMSCSVIGFYLWTKPHMRNGAIIPWLFCDSETY